MVPRSPARLPLFCALLLGAAAAAQQPPHRQVETAVDFATGQDDNLFSLVRSQEQIHAYRTALAEIAAGEHRTGVEKLHAVLQEDGGGVVPVAPGRFLGLRLATVLALANLPPAAHAAYEDLVRREGGAIAAFDSLDDEQLERLAERFPAAAIGRRARLRLGDRALAAGDGLRAVAHFRSALDAAAIGSAEERRITERWHAAMVLLDPRAARAAAARGQLPAAVGDVLDVLPPSSDATLWPCVGGGAAGTTPMAPLLGQPDSRWSEEVIAPGFGDRESGLFAMHAVGDFDGIYVNTGYEVFAFDPLRRSTAWVSASPMRLQRVERDDFRRRRDDSGSINQDMVLAAACSDDVVVAALQVPDKSTNVDFQGAYRVMSKIPMRRLHAFGRQSGKLLWAHYDDLDGPRTRRFRGHDVCASPLIAGDTVFVPTHDRSGAIAFAVTAYELRTGQPLWRRLVCSSQQEVNMFGNARTEFAASPLALYGGVLYGASNLGVCYALEAASGRIRWVAAYDVLRMPQTMVHQQRERPVFFANNAPVVVGGVLCATPTDSQFVLGIDAENGRPLWRLPAEATVDGIDHRVYWLAGALGDEFVLSGIGAIAVAARPAADGRGAPAVRSLVRPEAMGDRRSGALPARPAVTGDAVWFPRHDALAGYDRHGVPLPDTPIRLGRFLPGNLLLVSGLAVSLRQHSVEAIWNAAALRARVEQLAKARPDDPAALLRLGTLRAAMLAAHADSEAEAAVQAIFEAGLAAARRRGLPESDPVRQTLATELYQRALAAAEAALRQGRPDVVRLFAAARDAAPDAARWLQAHAFVLARTAGDRQRHAEELDRLLAYAPDAVFPDGDGVPVRAWVARQRALLAGDPTSAVLAWQEVLERHGDVLFGDRPGTALARDAIERLVQQHGPAVYAPVQQRAAQALDAAGDDAEALTLLARSFPNSTAAAAARARLLDAAVRRGDLAVVAGVLAELLPATAVPPGIARRVMVAAAKAGNAPLAAAMAAQLRPHAALPSEWPDDRGLPLREILDAAPATTAPPPAPLPVPAEELARIRPRSAREFFATLPVHEAPGFAAPTDRPLYVRSGSELLAIDVQAAGADKPVLFALPSEYLEHLVLCGTTLIVPDMERVYAVDYRTGGQRWELPNPRRLLLESLGVDAGVLHVTAIANTPEAGTECLGIEPLSGRLLWSTRTRLKPKSVPGALLHLALAPDGTAAIQELDPVLGGVRRTTPIAGSELTAALALAPDDLSTRLYAQSLATDGQRLLLPAEAAANGGEPRLFAVDAGGGVGWRWRGRPGGQLAMVAVRGERGVVLEAHDRQPGRLHLLRLADGSVLREAVVGHRAVVLNWERSPTANPAPAVVLIESFADPDQSQRQLVCVAVDDDGPAFALALGAGDGEIVPTPQLGDGFVAFVTRPTKGQRETRLHVVSLQNRSGLLPDGRRHRVLAMPGAGDGVTRLGPHLLVASPQTFLLLGAANTLR